MAKLPLEGIRIADFTWVWAGPYCTLQLAHLGADVIRIETRTRPCITRVLPPWPKGQSPGLNRSGDFNQYNQGKRSLTLNFKQPAAHEVARRLIAQSDVVVNNFAHGVMDRMGFGYEALKQIKPDIIMISLSGYGDTGPYKDFIAYGPAQVPLSGLSALTGYKGWPPMHSGFSYADPNAGVHGAFAIIAALIHRHKTGEGQYIDMSQWETMMALLPEGILEYTFNGVAPERNGNADPYMAPHGVYRCLNRAEQIAGNTIDQFVAIACANDAQWASLARLMGRPELATDSRFVSITGRKANEDALNSLVNAWTSTQRAPEVVESLQAAGVAAGVVADNKFLSEEDAHLREREYWVYKEHAEVGAMQHAGVPWKMSRTPTEVRFAAPLIGQHTEEILTGLLGYSADEVAALQARGALE
jgi:crotonobetainyl-CoA:carnitine CoA-transferase CaiB-like acyl-CoA transferase